MNKIDIYTSGMCPYCTKAKRLLKMLNLNYIEHNVDESFDEMCKEIGEKFKMPISTVPQIVINDQYIGGYSDLEAMHKSGKLKNYLN